MIRALVRGLRRVDLRRVAGFVALLAFVVVVVAGAAHLAETGDAHGGDGCSLCVALVATATASVPAPAVLSLAAPDDVRVAGLAAHAPLLAFESGRIAAPRGPPAVV